MGRKKKFSAGDVVVWVGPEGLPAYAVVVDYRQNGKQQGSYRLVRVTHGGRGGQLYGHTFWLPSWKMTPTSLRYKRAVSVVRGNDRLGLSRERGCSCQCCVHTAVALSQIRPDGTFQWEHDLDEQEEPATMGFDHEQEVRDGSTTCD